MSILDEIQAERDLQKIRWTNDDSYTLIGWAGLIAGWSARIWIDREQTHDSEEYRKAYARKRLIQTAAICLAAIESLEEK